MMVRRSVLLLIVAAVAAWPTRSMNAAELEIGAKGPDFTAKGIDGKEYSLDSTKGAKATVLVFTCTKCPVAIAYEDRMIEFRKKFESKEVALLAINVNSSEDLDAMMQRAEEKGFNFPFVYDASGDSARAYGARVTPHVFVLDSQGAVAYQGAFDDKQSNPTTPHVENAVKAILAGEKPEVQSTKPFGCGIKPNKK